MKLPLEGAIDCDLHPGMPGVRVLLPYMNEYWRDQLANRHIDTLPFALSSYPPSSPLSARPDWRPASGPPGDLDAIRRQALDPFRVRYAICNPLHGAVALFNDDMAAALCSAINDWMAKELLDREPRLRASILVPAQSPELAVREIERIAPDRRFVQVLLLAMGETPLGRRVHWPIYAAAETHELAIGIMPAVPTVSHRPISAGPPNAWRTTWPWRPQTQLLSLVAEGVFRNSPSSWCWRSGSHLAPDLALAHGQDRGVRAEHRGSTAPRRRSCASMCASRCSPSMRHAPIRPPWRALSTGLGSACVFSTDYPLAVRRQQRCLDGRRGHLRSCSSKPSRPTLPVWTPQTVGVEKWGACHGGIAFRAPGDCARG
jgi:predicted TIM-barrel fold metal-dependent hydrolase